MVDRDIFDPYSNEELEARLMMLDTGFFEAAPDGIRAATQIALLEVLKRCADHTQSPVAPDVSQLLVLGIAAGKHRELLKAVEDCAPDSNLCSMGIQEAWTARTTHTSPYFQLAVMRDWANTAARQSGGPYDKIAAEIDAHYQLDNEEVRDVMENVIAFSVDQLILNISNRDMVLAEIIRQAYESVIAWLPQMLNELTPPAEAADEASAID